MMQLGGGPVLVTGAEGFIGSAVVHALVQAGVQVHASIFDQSTLWRLQDVLDHIVLNTTDITDAQAARNLIRRTAPVSVIHLAAAVDTRRDPKLFPRMLEVNVAGTWHMLEALRGHSVRAAVFAGTAEEYGDNLAPFAESQRETPVSPYSWSKTAATHLVQTYHRLYDVPACVIRFSVTYGPGQDNELFIPALIRACLAGQALAMTSGEQTREFNYVDDITRGILRAAVTPEASGRVINLSAGQEYRLRDVAELVLAVTGTSVRPRIGALPYRIHESMRHICAHEDGQRLLGWRPEVKLQEGLERTVAWFREYLTAGIAPSGAVGT